MIGRVLLLGLGEVGAVLAQDLDPGYRVELVTWDRLLDDPSSKPVQHLLRNKRLCAATSAMTAAQNCDLVISAVTAGQNIAAAESVLPGLAPGCLFLDLNSVSPATKRQMAELVETAGGRYIEAAVLSPIEPERLGAPIVLGGEHAEVFIPQAVRLGFSGMRFVSREIGRAAATKMCRSVIIKGMEALLSEALLSARHFGVEREVLASLDNLFPRDDCPQHAYYMISRTLEHGTRRAEEMCEVARTVAEAGLRPLMSEACEQRQTWASQFADALARPRLDELLDHINASIRRQNHH